MNKKYFGYDQVCYTIDNQCVEVPELSYDDGLQILYFCTTGTKGGNNTIKNMLNFLQHSNVANVVDDSTRMMYDYVSQVKIQSEARERYMSWDVMFDLELEEAKDEARKEGREEGREEGNIRHLLHQVSVKVTKGKMPEEIAEDLEEEVETIQTIYDVVVKCGVDCSEDDQYAAYLREQSAVANE